MSKEKTAKAKARLKEFALFSEDIETFKEFFKDNLKSNKLEEANELLLLVVFDLLKSDGELFNELLLKVDKAKCDGLKSWVRDSLKKVGG